jgi:dTDP-4-amino-4,6-dideoxygalactose transaminase
MITTVPLPSWRELATSLTGPKPNDDELARPWKRGTESAFWFSRAAWALKVLVIWWEGATGRNKPIVWLPDYFCNQSTLPVRDTGARLIFYPVGPDLEPKWSACQTLAETEKPDLFILVHYFGKSADGAKARSFCDGVGAYLIEDAAHVLSPADGIGGHGDFTFYSPYKIFPVPDGAVLLVRDRPVAEAVETVVNALPGAAPSPWLWQIKRLLQKIVPALLLEKRARARRPNFNDDPPLALVPATPRLSAAARRMLAKQGRRMAEIAAARKAHAGALRAQIKSSPKNRPLLSIAEEGAAPYRFPLIYSDQARAAGLFNYLSEKGCPVETWPDLPPEVTAQPETHAEALRLRQTMVFLPVHQSAEPDQLTECCSVDELA